MRMETSHAYSHDHHELRRPELLGFLKVQIEAISQI